MRGGNPLAVRLLGAERGHGFFHFRQNFAGKQYVRLHDDAAKRSIGGPSERFGQRGAAEEAEGGGGVKFYVHGTNSITPNSQRLRRGQFPRFGSWDKKPVGRWELSSVDDSLEEPVVRIALVEDAIGRAVVERHVPLVPIPSPFAKATGDKPRHITAVTCPPGTRGAPRPGTLLDPSPTQSPPIRRHP